MLAILIERAKFDGQIEGVIPDIFDGGLAILQHADDMILLWTMILKNFAT
jgi:hypothetical protein